MSKKPGTLSPGSGRTRNPLATVENVLPLYRQGVRVSLIARQLKASDQTIFDIIKEHGLSRPRPTRSDCVDIYPLLSCIADCNPCRKKDIPAKTRANIDRIAANVPDECLLWEDDDYIGSNDIDYVLTLLARKDKVS